jgi:hypothetical protein
MSGATLTTLSPLLAPVTPGPAQSLVFSETDFINFLRGHRLGSRFIARLGQFPRRWNLITSENASAEVFVENQALPAAGQTALAQAVLQCFYVWSVYSLTGHVRDQAQGGGMVQDPRQLEYASAARALMLKLEQSLLGSTYGLPTVIDSSDTYASLTTGAVPAWAAYENPVGGGLSLTVLGVMYAALVARGAAPTDILASQTQVDKYVNLANIAAANAALLGTLPGQTGARVDLGGRPQGALPSYNGIPFSMQRNMTTSELYMLDFATGAFQFSAQRDLRVDVLARRNDNEESELSIGGALEVERRDRQGKLTGLTT